MTLQKTNMDYWKQNKPLRVHRGISRRKSAVDAQHTFGLSVERPNGTLLTTLGHEKLLC